MDGLSGVSVMTRAADADFVGRAAPGLDEVLARGMVLTAVAYRGWSEVRERAEKSRHETRSRLLRWLESQGVSGALERDEQRFLNADVGATDPDVCLGYAWRVEGAAVLAWAARLVEMPPYWELARLPDVLSAMDDVTKGAKAPGPLRPESEVVTLMHGAMDLLSLLDQDGGLARHEQDRDLIERAAFERAKATRWLTGIGATYAEAAVPLGTRVLV